MDNIQDISGHLAPVLAVSELLYKGRMRKTKKTKQSSSVARRSLKRLKSVTPAPSVPAAAPIAFNDLFPVDIHKPDTTADTASLGPEPQNESNFGQKAA
jgi:hypothetical protein